MIQTELQQSTIATTRTPGTSRVPNRSAPFERLHQPYCTPLFIWIRCGVLQLPEPFCHLHPHSSEVVQTSHAACGFHPSRRKCRKMRIVWRRSSPRTSVVADNRSSASPAGIGAFQNSRNRALLDFDHASLGRRSMRRRTRPQRRHTRGKRFYLRWRGVLSDRFKFAVWTITYLQGYRSQGSELYDRRRR